MTEEGPKEVGIGLIRLGDFFLVRKRPEGAPMAGYWEFPGGKCETGEFPEEAAVRECREETGLNVRVVRLRSTVEHRYAHAWVRMSFFDVEPLDPQAELMTGSGFVWKSARELTLLRFPGANESILAELNEIGRDS